MTSHPGAITVAFTVNGQPVQAEAPAEMTLLEFLRDKLRLTGAKNGCASGHCGACTVILNGKATRACLVKMVSPRLAGAHIETIEGLAAGEKLHVLPAAFVEHNAVQCGFCTPGILMTAKALLDRAPEPPADEIREALAENHNLCRCTGYVSIIRAIQDAGRRLATGEQWVERGGLTHLRPADGPRLKPDAISLATGETLFTDDLTVEGMLHGKILWAAHPSAQILGVDTSAAEALPGVVRVLTAKDIPGQNICGLVILDQPAIAADRVRSIADPVAAVIAETEEAAKRALAQIRVDYRVLPGVFTPEEAARPDAPKVHEQGNLFHQAQILRGDVDEAFARCAVVIEHTYTTPRVEHGFLEPESGIGFPTEDGGVLIRMGTQTVFDDRAQVARILGLPEEKVRVVQMPMGGAFGGREDLIIQQFLGLGALLCQRPVKITLTREESLRCHQKRHPAIMRFKTGADAAGRLLAVEADVTLDTGAYASLGLDILENTVEFACGPYYVPNIRVQGESWFTNNVLSGAMRGFGVNQVAFALESNLDEIARALGMDPFELRLLNALEDGLPTAADHLLEPGMCGVKQTLLAAREALAQLELPQPAPGKRIGVGVASAVKNIGYGHHIPESAGAIVELDSGGVLTIWHSQHEYGQGADAGLVRLAAEQLGIPPDRVHVIGPDTALTPVTGPTTASRQTFLTGKALLLAVNDLKDQAFGHAAETLETAPGSVRLVGAELVDAASGRAMPIAALGERLRVGRTYTPPDTDALPSASLRTGLNEERSRVGSANFRSRVSFYCYAYSTQVAVVEVDERTGDVRVLTVIAANDVGHAINPGAIVGQIEGGVMMGLGFALSEEYVVREGYNLTDSLHKCRLPGADETPEVIPLIVEVPHPYGPLGVKGFAEAPSLATAPAILNAVYDAVGVRIRDLPARREKIKRVGRCSYVCAERQVS
jgi:CO/xanthine dehydrogenase Mo-binding subunit/aerobic-type carbon monoxide dehydrogenase small subunit (CoxS/CutS family)